MDHQQEVAGKAPVADWKDSEPLLTITAANMAQRPLRKPSGSHERSGPTQLAALTLPVLVVIVPITLLTTILVALIIGYQVKEQPGLFPSTTQPPVKHPFILVNFSATRLVFLASWLSTLAPILAGPLMKIWRLQAAQSLQVSSTISQTDLPTVSQFSSLLGFLEASTDPLLEHYKALGSRLFHCHPRTPKTTSQRPRPLPLIAGSTEPSSTPLIAQRPLRLSAPSVLRKAETVVTLCTLSAIAVFAADTWLDIFTETIRFEARSTTQLSSLFGRGINPKCLSFNRTANYCFPCSYAEIPYWSDSEISSQHNEMFFLQHNDSLWSEIQFIEDGTAGDEGLAILMPQTVSLPAKVDFRSSTIGVSTQCSPISSKCNMRASEIDVFHTQFNCSPSFWGVLGKPPNITEINENKTKSVDPDLPGLDWKPSPDLQYGYFRDTELVSPYNPIGYNPETGDPDPSIPCIPDDKLLNPVYLGVAGRFAVDSEAAGSLLSNDSGLWKGPNQYIDFALGCFYRTYDVNYTWVNGTVRNVSYIPSPNGSISEIFHGMQIYDTISGGNVLLQNNLLLAALQNTSTAIATEWGRRNSVWVLSTIGAYTVPRTNLQEQIRTELLVAKIPIAALLALVASSLIYVVLASVLGIVTYRSSKSRDLRHIAAQLNRDGVCAAAFGKGAVSREMMTVQPSGKGPGEGPVDGGWVCEQLTASRAPLVGETMQGEHSLRVGVCSAGDYHGGSPFTVFDVLQDSGLNRPAVKASASSLV